MTPRLATYLWDAYRRDVLGESVKVEAPARTPELLAEVNAEMADIEKLRLGASLASRDFAAYQRRRALAGLLAYWEESHAA